MSCSFGTIRSSVILRLDSWAHGATLSQLCAQIMRVGLFEWLRRVCACPMILVSMSLGWGADELTRVSSDWPFQTLASPRRLGLPPVLLDTAALSMSITTSCTRSTKHATTNTHTHTAPSVSQRGYVRTPPWALVIHPLPVDGPQRSPSIRVRSQADLSLSQSSSPHPGCRHLPQPWHRFPTCTCNPGRHKTSAA